MLVDVSRGGPELNPMVLHAQTGAPRDVARGRLVPHCAPLPACLIHSSTVPHCPLCLIHSPTVPHCPPVPHTQPHCSSHCTIGPGLPHNTNSLGKFGVDIYGDVTLVDQVFMIIAINENLLLNLMMH